MDQPRGPPTVLGPIDEEGIRRVIRVAPYPGGQRPGSSSDRPMITMTNMPPEDVPVPIDDDLDTPPTRIRYKRPPTDMATTPPKRIAPPKKSPPQSPEHAQLLGLLHNHEQDIECGLAEPVTRPSRIPDRVVNQTGTKKTGFNQGNGLKSAYNSDPGMFQKGSTFYLAGTRFNHAEDVLDDLKLVIPGQGVRATAKYQKAAAYIRAHPEIKLVVGHSLGAAVADALAIDFKLKEMAYGDPIPTYIMGKGHHRNWGDLVAIADVRTNMNFPNNWNPHDFWYEASRYANDEYDNQ